MLKRTFTILALGLSMTLFAQEKTAEEKLTFTFSEVVQAEGATKDQLFKSARAWFLDNYGKKKQELGVIYTDDSYLGEIAANPLLWVYVQSMGHSTNAGSVSYNIAVSAKEGKYKFDITEFYHEANRSAYGTGGSLMDDTPDCEESEMSALVWEAIKKDSHSKIQALISSLKEKMAGAAAHVEGEDW